MTQVLHQPSSDIFVKGRALGLSSHAPELYHDYAVSRETAISIMPDMEKLLANPDFRSAVRHQLGALNLVEIQVRGSDNQVLIRDPSSPRPEFIPVSYVGTGEVRAIADKTQRAYQEYRSSLPSSSHSSPTRRVPSPVHEQGRFASRSFEHIPSHSVDPGLYESRIHDLERENIELRGRNENLELRRELAETERLIDHLRSELQGQGEEAEQLGEQVDVLRTQLADEREAHQQTNANLQSSVLTNLFLGAALLHVGGRNTELERQLQQLEEQNRLLQINTGIQGAILQQAQELTGAASPAELCGKIGELQAALEAEQEKSQQLEHSLSQSEYARRDLESAIESARQELERLEPENAQLKRELASAKQELAEIADAVQEGRGPSESLPALARRYHDTIAQLQDRLEAASQENRAFRGIIQDVCGRLSKPTLRDRDLPGAVGELRTAHEDSERARKALDQELQALREEHTESLALLDQIAAALDSRGVGHESLPQLVEALSGDNQGLRQRIATFEEAERAQQDALSTVERLVGRPITSIEALPGAVESALGAIQREAESSHQRAEFLAQELQSSTEELRQLRAVHTDEIDAQKEEIRTLERQAIQAEATLEGEELLVEEEQSIAKALRRDLGKAKKALEEAQQQHAEVEAELSEEVERLGQVLESERSTNQRLQQDIQALQHEARQTASRHKDELRRQEEAHQHALAPLERDLREARQQLSASTKYGQTQDASVARLTKRVAQLEEQLEQAEARRERELHTQEESHQAVVRPLRAELEEARDLNGKQASALALLTDQLRDATEKLSEATKLGKTQEASIERLTKHVAQLEEQLEQAEVSRLEELRIQEESHQEALSPIQSELLEVRQQFSDAREYGQDQDASVARLTERVAQLEQELEQAETRRERELAEQDQAHEEVLRRVESELLEASGLLSSALAKGDAQQASIDRLSDQVAAFESQLQERAEISSDALQQLQEEVGQLKGLLGAIDAIADRVPIDREPQSLAEQIAAIDQEPNFDQLPAKVQEVIHALSKQIQELKAKDQAAQDKLVDIEDLQSRLRDQNQASTEAVGALEAQLAQKELEVAEIRNDAYALGQKQAGLVGVLRQTLRQERTAAAREKAEKEEEIRGLEQALIKSEKAREVLAGKLEKQGIELQTAKDEIDDLDEHNERLIREKRTLEKQVQTIADRLNTMREDRDCWQEESEHYESHYIKLRAEHSQLKERYHKLEEDIALLRGILGTTLGVEADLDPSGFTHASRALRRSVEDLTAQNAHLVQQVEKAERSRAFFEEQAEQRGSELEARGRELGALRGENTQLREALVAEQHSAEIHERALQRAIERHEAELLRLQEAEELRRLELTPEEIQRQNAAATGELMAEISQGLDGAIHLADIVSDPKMIPFIEEYLRSLESGELPQRYTQTVSSQVNTLNSMPGKLSDLSLFTGFFNVTDHISRLRSSREFIRLKANNHMIGSLDAHSDQSTINKLKQENAAIVKRLLKGFFDCVSQVTRSKHLSRYNNIGAQLWMWNSILNGLAPKFYQEGESGRTFRVELTKAEEMRTTVHDLHTKFQQMMLPLQKKSGMITTSRL